MGKRTKERSEEELRRKIRKLQDRLNSVQPSQHDFNDSPQDQQAGHLRASPERDEVLTVDLDYEYTDYEDVAGEFPPNSSRHMMAQASPPPRSSSPPKTQPSQPPASPSPPSAPLLPVLGTSSAEVEPQELELEDDILELLGDAPKIETPLGPPIHKDVASRWQEILAKGLNKDIKDSLLKAYFVPSNCDLLIAPKLNPEVKMALAEPLVKRDTSLFYKQKQIGVALAALATAMNSIVSNVHSIQSKQEMFKPISDACRILCDSHAAETKTRRRFVILAINTKLKDTLLETNRNSMLFGDNVTEKVKAAKTIQQSGDALKNQQKMKTPTARPNNDFNRKKGNLNYLGQHRKVDNKPQSGVKRLPWAAQRMTANTTGSSSRQRRFSPPRTSPQRALAHHRK